jgi:hypothetical protein
MPPPASGGQPTDEDGFITVQRKGTQAKAVAAPAPQEGQGGGGHAAATAADAAAAGGTNGGGGSHQGGGSATPPLADAQGEEDAGASAPTSDELKEDWQRRARLVEFLAQQGYGADDPSRQLAEQQAADAERAWRGSTPGVAVSKRLRGAEEALLRAKKAQAKQEQAIDNLDQWYEVERQSMAQHLAELRSRTREREQKLGEVSREVADTYHAPPGGRGAEEDEGDDALREAVDTVEGKLAPVMRDIIGQLPEGTELRQKVSDAMGSISHAYSLMHQAARARAADRYCIADYGEDDGGDAYDRGDWSMGHADEWAYGEHWTSCSDWHGADWGHATAAQFEYGGAAPQHAAMDTAEVQVPRWWRPQAAEDGGAAWGSRAWKRGRWYNQDCDGLQGRQLMEEAATVDHENAAKLQAQLGDATMAAAAVALPLTPATQEEAAQQQRQQQQQLQQQQAAAAEAAAEAAAAAAQLEKKRREVWDAAQEEGAEISCADIAAMSWAELEEWAQAHLDRV